MSTHKVWSGVLAGVKSQVSSSAFRTWFSGSVLLEAKKTGGRDILVVGTRNNFLKEQLETKYLPLIAEQAKVVGFENCEFVFVVNSAKGEVPKAEPLFSGVAPTYIASVRKADSLNPQHTFENFIIGPSNNLAHMACVQAAANLGSLYNPVYVYGPSGVGKTHLLQAFGNSVLSKVIDAKVLYVSSEKFTNDYIESLNNRTQQAFRQKYRNVDLLLVDDVQFFAGKEGTQDEFFHTFNELVLSGRQVVLAGDKHPKELVRLNERLASRFMGGMTVDISKADFELRCAILTAKCKEKGLFLSEEILGYIAQSCESGARELEGVLVQVLSMTRLTGADISLDDIKRTVEGRAKINVSKAVTSGQVISAVSKYFKVAGSDICGPKRKSKFVWARQVLMYLLRQDIKLPLESIGNLVGGRDHSTVLYGIEKVGKLSADINIRDQIARIRSNF